MSETETDSPRPVARRSRRASLAFLLFGAAVALYLGRFSPREQSVRFVLGDGAKDVRVLEVGYETEAGEIVRDARFAFEEGRAPRVVSHAPSLPDGDYRLQLHVETREGRRSAERRVTLGGGSTQVDLSGVLK